MSRASRTCVIAAPCSPSRPRPLRSGPSRSNDSGSNRTPWPSTSARKSAAAASETAYPSSSRRGASATSGCTSPREPMPTRRTRTSVLGEQLTHPRHDLLGIEPDALHPLVVRQAAEGVLELEAREAERPRRVDDLGRDRVGRPAVDRALGAELQRCLLLRHRGPTALTAELVHVGQEVRQELLSRLLVTRRDVAR